MLATFSTPCSIEMVSLAWFLTLERWYYDVGYDSDGGWKGRDQMPVKGCLASLVIVKVIRGQQSVSQRRRLSQLAAELVLRQSADMRQRSKMSLKLVVRQFNYIIIKYNMGIDLYIKYAAEYLRIKFQYISQYSENFITERNISNINLFIIII